MMEQLKTEPSAELAPPPAAESPRRGHKVRIRRKSRVPEDSVTQERWGIFQPLPPWVWWWALALAGCGVFTANPLLTPFAILLLPVFGSLLWFSGEPPVLAVACAMQWIQATAVIFYTDFYGVPLVAAWGGRREIEQATWLTLIGVLVVAVGMRLALVRRKKQALAQAEYEARSLQPGRIFSLYLIAFPVFSPLQRVAFSIPSLTQPLLAVMSLKWVFVFLIAYAVVVQQRYYSLLLITVCLEFATGVLGYFAGFRDIFVLLMVVLTSTRTALKGWRLAQLGALAALVLVTGVVWSAIKMEYREFMNQGSGQQEVVVSVNQRMAKLGELVSRLDSVTLQAGLEDATLRMSYVSYFAMSLVHVPAVIPHENGALWGGAIMHVLKPRIFFPNKPIIDDSVRTRIYTGLEMAGSEEGTSISLGYVGESYVDFGEWGMFAPILLLGIFYGVTYRFFSAGKHTILGLAMATAILLFTATKVESSNIKIVGGNLMGLIVIGLFAKFLGPPMWAWITDTGRVRSTVRKASIKNAEKLKS